MCDMSGYKVHVFIMTGHTAGVCNTNGCEVCAVDGDRCNGDADSVRVHVPCMGVHNVI